MIAAALAEGWMVSVPDHEGAAGVWGAPASPAITCWTACARHSPAPVSASPPTPR